MGLSSVTTSNPRPCKGAILGVQFNADIAAVKAFRCKSGGAASKKRVKDNAACRTARQYARFRELRGIGGKMPALIRYGIDKPNVPLVSCGRHKGVVMIAAAAGADARMAGAPVSVVANSGSGNQGITATMPVVAAAHWLDIDEPTMLRAVTLSNLIAIRIKSKFGRLSNLCGATVAGTGAACGITYLLGGGYHEICCAIQNMVGNVTGMVCDGAKADCALKISTCVNAACQAAAMGTRGVRVQSTDGIVEENVERTLDNFAILSTHGTSDSVILDLMLNKEHAPDAE